MALNGKERLLVNGQSPTGGLSSVAESVSTQDIANLGVQGSVTIDQILALDFSSAPTSDPGGGKLWLNGNVLSVGTVTV